MTIDDQQQSTSRLWTPWRGDYVVGGSKENGCIFCNRLQRSNDVDSLILFRATHSFVIMNLFPYNTGHIMLVPNEHSSDPSQLSLDDLAELGTLLPSLTNALRRAFDCHGFNVGLNIGATAGAGVEAHLHQHIVPRWQGDANFMPILASTMTIPELIPVSFAKIRAELVREIMGATTAQYLLFDEHSDRVLLQDGTIPAITLRDNESIVTSIVGSLPHELRGARLSGWAGPEILSFAGPDIIMLTFAIDARVKLPSGWRSVSYDDAIDGEQRAAIDRAIRQRAPRY